MRLEIAALVFFVSISVSADPARIACVGDSLTDSPYPVFLKEMCGNRCEVKTWAKKGGTMFDISFLFEKAMGIYFPDRKKAKFNPTHVVVYGGINDCMKRPAKGFNVSQGDWTWGYFESVVEIARENNVIPVVVAHHGWAGRSQSGNRCSSVFNARLFNSSVARIVDTAELSSSDGVLKKQYDSGDGLHLNRRGYRQLAKMVYTEIFPCW